MITTVESVTFSTVLHRWNIWLVYTPNTVGTTGFRTNSSGKILETIPKEGVAAERKNEVEKVSARIH